MILSFSNWFICDCYFTVYYATQLLLVADVKLYHPYGAAKLADTILLFISGKKQNQYNATIGL